MSDADQDFAPFRALRKLGTVTTAAMALLANNASEANQNDIMRTLMGRTSTIVDLEERKKPTVPPLILRPGPSSGVSIARGHSSHSSHSSHRSHASSSMGPGRPAPDQRDLGTRTAPPRSSSNLDPAPNTTTKPEVAADASIQAPPLAPEKTVQRKYTPPDGVDLDDPSKRFLLLSITQSKEEPKAFIKDLKDGRATMFTRGEEIDEYTIRLILPSEQKVTIYDKKGKESVIKKSKK